MKKKPKLSEHTKSIMQDDESYCYICNQPTDHIHHVFNGFAYRTRSEIYGLHVGLCYRHHEMIHQDQKLDEELKRKGEIDALVEYDWRISEFRQMFGKNYIGLENK